jgi:hypothetical protein
VLLEPGGGRLVQAEHRGVAPQCAGQGAGFWGWGVGCGIQGLRFETWGSGFRQ